VATASHAFWRGYSEQLEAAPELENAQDGKRLFYF